MSAAEVFVDLIPFFNLAVATLNMVVGLRNDKAARANRARAAFLKRGEELEGEIAEMKQRLSAIAETLQPSSERRVIPRDEGEAWRKR